MTRTIRRTSQFKKDVKRQEKRGKDFKEFKGLVNKIIEGVPLPSKYRDHKLLGNYRKYKDVRECHVEPDWLLIYLKAGGGLVLVRAGARAGLFG